jgi:hypothetical protein
LAAPETSAAGLPAEVSLTRFFPMLMKRRGVELRLVVENRNGPASSVDLTLLKAVSRAHRWFAEISSGKTPSLAHIAAREGIAVRYVSRLIRLAFLAPDIVKSIVEGRQPSDLTAQALTRQSRFRSNGVRRELRSIFNSPTHSAGAQVGGIRSGRRFHGERSLVELPRFGGQCWACG